MFWKLASWYLNAWFQMNPLHRKCTTNFIYMETRPTKNHMTMSDLPDRIRLAGPHEHFTKNPARITRAWSLMATYRRCIRTRQLSPTKWKCLKDSHLGKMTIRHRITKCFIPMSGTEVMRLEKFSFLYQEQVWGKFCSISDAHHKIFCSNYLTVFVTFSSLKRSTFHVWMCNTKQCLALLTVASWEKDIASLKS